MKDTPILYMSKIGRIPVKIHSGVTVASDSGKVVVSGSKGELNLIVPNGINVAVMDDKIVVSQNNPNDVNMRPMFGLTRALLANLVEGVSKGFEKKLELSGVGYRAQMQGSDLQLSLGFSHPVKIKAKPGIAFSVVDNVISVKGIDKIIVGEMAAEIRAIRPPEPYKGKGIKYVGEYIRRKAGKAAKAVGAAK